MLPRASDAATEAPTISFVTRIMTAPDTHTDTHSVANGRGDAPR
jgi:hypothetical protein